MHHVDANKIYGEKTWRQLHKNVVSYIEQFLETAPHKKGSVQPLPPITKTIKIRWTRHTGHCWRSRDELVSDILLWTPLHGWAKVECPAQTYIQQLCVDTGCSPEDLPKAMDDRGGERGSEISMLIAWHDIYNVFFFITSLMRQEKFFFSFFLQKIPLHETVLIYFTYLQKLTGLWILSNLTEN